LHEQKKDYKDSIVYYKKTIKLNPAHVKSLSRLGCLLANSGQNEKGKKYYLKVVEIDPLNVNALFALSKLHHNTSSDLESAVKKYWKVIELDPSHFKAMC